MFDHSLHSAQFMGIVNALRTGDPTVDMISALLLPLVIRAIVKELPPLWRKSLSHFKKKEPKQPIYSRTITYRTSQNQCGNIIDFDATSQNAQLIRAVHLYVHHNCQLELKDANIDLTNLQDDSKNGARRNNGTSTSPVGVLETCQLVEHPILNTWHTVGCFAGSVVKACTSDSSVSSNQGGKGSRSEEERSGDNGNQDIKTRALKICLQSQGGAEPINEFLQTALDWYISEIKKLDQKDRYFFDVQSFSHSRSNSPNYKAFKLGNEKTFDTLFSQQSRALLKIVDQFEAKTGKYAVKGYPYKLGLLLSGPPGTGKTSLIKALAHYTGRHIVNVPLSRISSNTELTNIFFNKNYAIGDNSALALQLDFSKLIMVLEDVDCSTDAVKRRTIPKKKKPNRSSTPGSKRSALTAASIFTDPLDLSGLLNVLDGIVETPGRIVIMTTNHPEVLDPALIRPGRIDKKLIMGPLLTPDAILMIEHYYQTKLSPNEKEQITVLLDTDGLEVTPAELEQLAMEEDTVESLSIALGNLVIRSVPPTAPNTSSEEAENDIQTTSSEEEDDATTTLLSLLAAPLDNAIGDY